MNTTRKNHRWIWLRVDSIGTHVWRCDKCGLIKYAAIIKNRTTVWYNVDNTLIQRRPNCTAV
jgi:ribosomal protein L37AE/L43A